MELHKFNSEHIKSIWIEGEKFNYKLEYLKTGSNFHVIPTFCIYLEAFSYKYDGISINFCWLQYRLSFSINMDTKKWCERNNVNCES